MYCDYHGHSRRKNVFMYGCSRKESVLAGETDALAGAPDDTGFKVIVSWCQCMFTILILKCLLEAQNSDIKLKNMFILKYT